MRLLSYPSWTPLAENTGAADRPNREAHGPPVVNEIHVEAPAEIRGNKSLQKVVRGLDIDVRGKEGEPR